MLEGMESIKSELEKCPCITLWAGDGNLDIETLMILSKARSLGLSEHDEFKKFVNKVFKKLKWW